jgi:outer membrane receptor for ferric coprogen and ferric-rhodotorulic acid
MSQSQAHDDLSGHLKLIAHPSERLNLWAGYATGYKAAGFNLDRAQTGLVPDRSTAFPAEDAGSFEVGARGTFADGRLTASLTAFRTRFENFQLNTFLGTTFVVRSVPLVTSEGLDADLRWRSGPFDLQGGAVLSDTRYGHAPLPGLPLLPGARLSFAPLWSANLAGGYDLAAGDWLTRLSFNAKYSSDYNTGSDLAPAKVQSAFALLGARVSFGPADRRWAVDVWAENLTDELYYQVAYNAPFQGSTGIRDTPAPLYDPARDTQTYGAFLGSPRTVGATFRWRAF